MLQGAAVDDKFDSLTTFTEENTHRCRSARGGLMHWHTTCTMMHAGTCARHRASSNCGLVAQRARQMRRLVDCLFTDDSRAAVAHHRQRPPSSLTAAVPLLTGPAARQFIPASLKAAASARRPGSQSPVAAPVAAARRRLPRLAAPARPRRKSQSP
jgi:hypothetical protein